MGPELSAVAGLSDGKLAIDAKGEVFIETSDGLLSARHGRPATPSGALDHPAINNRTRRTLATALARAQLRSTDRRVRREAAEGFARNLSEELVPEIRAALADETDRDVRELLQVALASQDLESNSIEQQLNALDVIESSGTVELIPGVRQLARGNATGVHPKVQKRASAVLTALERKVFWVSSAANLFYGMSLGSVLLLAALGLAITFGLMRVINMAHGEMLMLGAYSTYAVQNLFRSLLPGQFDLYLVFAVPVAFGVCALVGIFLERTVIRFLYGRPLETLLATWGISLGIIQTVRVIFGAQNVTVENPTWLSGGWELLPSIVLPYSRIATIIFSIVVVGFVWMLLQKTRLGLYVRAVTQNREMAGNVGIPTRRIDVWTFGLGSGVAGLGGVALSQLGNVGPELGQSYIVDSFMVVVLGGVGNIAGTVAGALGLGIANKFLEPLTGAVLGKIMLLVLLILFIQWRPQGMFAPKGRAAAEL
jgi:urea transport system permease protein